VFAIQTDIAKQVIRELGIALLEPDLRDIDAIPTASPAAHEAYLRAMGQLNIYDQESI
jgi:hypothetical protein